MSGKEEFNFNDAVHATRDGIADATSIANTLLAQLTLDERLSLLDGDEAFWPGVASMLLEGYNKTPIVHGQIDRLEIPGVRFADGPRGCVLGESTAFPVPMARGASWDVSLEERIGLAIGRECRAQGANFFAGVCVNLPRHPAWGRIQETYGEDPIILGELGAALVRGVQKNMMACVKHYALNSMENARFQVDVEVEQPVLHQVYLAHFRRIIEEGVASVMSSYNSVRGEFAGQNKELLTDILREQWGFQGFVISDFLFGLRDGPLSLKNGLDIEAPFQNIRSLTLKQALEAGTIHESDIDRACLAILGQQIRDAVRRDVSNPSMDVVFCDEHKQLAKEAAVKSMVLLQNKEVDGHLTLPLSAEVSSVAVIGRLANSNNTGDRGSSAVRCPIVVSPFQGLQAALPKAQVLLEDSDDVEQARKAASASEVAVVVVGYDWRDEGEYTIPPFTTNPGLMKILPPTDGSERVEKVKAMMLNQQAPGDISDDSYGLGAGGDRHSLRLRPRDVEIIKACTEVNPRTVVCIVAAGVVIMEEWDKLPAAVLYSWYSGCEGGHALADLLLGHANFSGRLPFSIPTTEEHLPFFDRDATKITYDEWFGQRLLDHLGVKAAYPLGYGLSYTSFKISQLEFEAGIKQDSLVVRASVENTGPREGRYVAQVYGVIEGSHRPRRVLLGFAPVDLEAGEAKTVEIPASTRPLKRWDQGEWSLASESINVEIGAYAGDEECVRNF
ncbi:glycoside hydrolase superfamily [Stachybotrys elegans]|uniref:beta-glucosidase n=1 Tax=Stachybotrys elegans TaxID=80388 RepID=A0A8K0SXN9_9HYPO|nr:glycoside hydrolase superfamily [Stachybotrys elegans]